MAMRIEVLSSGLSRRQRRGWSVWAMILAGWIGLSVAVLAVDGNERLYVNDKKAPENLKDLQKIQQELQAALPMVRKATVGIDLGGGAGSGVVVSKDGLVLTAAHVSGGVDKEMTVIFEDGKRVKARSLGLVASTDCAMMQISEEGEYPFVDLDQSDLSRLGDWVFSLGHSGGFDEERGVVVRLGRLVQVKDSTIQSDCNLIGGDSGGPLFDLQGRLIGIHSRVGASKEQNMHVPVREFLRHWDGMKGGEFIGEGPFAQKPVPGTGYLGAIVEDGEEGGAKVRRVRKETPADEAGLKEGDVITKIDGVDLEGKDALISYLQEKGAGERVELTILRDGEEQTMEVELGERPPQVPGFLGIRVGEREEGGVVIERVGEDTPAAESGLKTGDIIIKVDDEEIEDKASFSANLGARFGGDFIEVTISRDGKEQTLEIELGAK